MSRIRVNQFGGLQPIKEARLLPSTAAQVAHNCLLTDGSLRPMPNWAAIASGVRSIAPGQGNTPFVTSGNERVMPMWGPPFGTQMLSLDSAGNLQPVVSATASGTVSVTPGHLSKKPVSRVYAASAVKIVGNVEFEGPLTILDGPDARTIMFEGDIATISVDGNGDKLRVYRTTSDVTTGGGTNGAVTANWQMVAEVRGSSMVYVDAGAAAADSFDTYLYRGPQRPPFTAYSMGLLESSYVWIVGSGGSIALSDRHTYGHWPVENQYSLGGSSLIVTGAVSLGDTLYIGTQQGAFAAAAHVTETGGVVLDVKPIAGAPACVPNTMAATPSGALYTSKNGVVAVSGVSARMLTAELARGVAALLPDGTPLRFDQMTQAFYHGGRYYAFGEPGAGALPT